MKRPITTLFMIESLDGKISTGSTDEMDIDKDFPNITGLKEGLYQYYDIERTTDIWSLCTGKTQAKLGINNKEPEKSHDFNVVKRVLIDNHNINEQGLEYYKSISDIVVVVTTNKNHPAFRVDGINVIYQETLVLEKVLEELTRRFNCSLLTIQSGGTINSLFLRDDLIDYVDIVVAPVLIGGKDTPSLIDGKSLKYQEELDKIKVLTLEKCEILKNSYIRLRYKVGHDKKG